MSALNIKYPIILIDDYLTKQKCFVITISKPEISFSKNRLEGNIELINKKFCDSNGNIFKLVSLDKTKKDYNLINFVFNNFRFHTFGKYNFRKTQETLSFNQLKELGVKYMKIETIEEAWEKCLKPIQSAENFEDIIDNFGLGLQG